MVWDPHIIQYEINLTDAYNFSHFLRYQPFSKYTKYSEKQAFLTP